MVTTTDQGLSYIQYEADGVAVNFMLTFPYLTQADLHVYLDGVETFDFTWLNSSEITMDVAPANLALLTLKRLTERDERLVDFQDGGVIREATLDLDSNQLFYLTQEAIDTTAFNLAIDSTTSIIDAQNNRIINVADGADPQDAATVAQLTVVEGVSNTAAADSAAALIAANAAVVTANAIAATANAAAVDAAAALVAANAAVVTANGIAATAATALANANAAVITANAAGVDAAQAIADAATAQAAANAAQSTANTAITNAATAQSAANAAQSTANTAVSNAATAQAAADAALAAGIAHAALTVAHGATGAVVGTTNTQTLTNKTLTSPVVNSPEINNPSRLETKRDTKANLDTYAALGTSVNGQFVFATDLKKMYHIVDNILTAIGGGAGGLTTAFQLIAEENITDWSTGDNASFLGGGTISGTFAKNAATPIQGLASYKYTQAAGSLNDYMASAAQSLDRRFRGRECTFTMSNSYDGALGDIEVIFYDVTNTAIIPSSVFVPANSSLNKFATNILVPSTCTSIRVGFMTRVLNSGKIFEFDSIEFGLDSTLYANISNDTEWASAGLTTADFVGFGTVTNIEIQSRRSGTDILYRGRWTNGTVTGVEARVNLRLAGTAVTSATTSSIPAIQKCGSATYNAVASGNTIMLIEPSTAYLTFGYETSGLAGLTKQTGTNLGGTGAIVSFEARVPINGWYNSNANVLTVPDTFSTDTAPLVYASSSLYTLATLPTAPIGTIITQTLAINSNTRTQTTTAPTQTVASMAANGIQIFSRAYNAASTAGNPTIVSIQIGKNLKGVMLNAYLSAAKVTPVSIDNILPSTTAQYGAYWTYDEVSGVLTIDAGTAQSASNTTRTIGYDSVGNTNNSSSYVVISASKNPALTGLNLDNTFVQAAGNAGQSITAATTDISFTEVLDSHSAWNGNQFTVPSTGSYTLCGLVLFTAANTGNKLRLYINGTLVKVISYDDDVSSIASLHFNVTDRFTKGQVLSIRSQDSKTLSNSTDFHWITITKVNVG